jgi:hypothetical protein
MKARMPALIFTGLALVLGACDRAPREPDIVAAPFADPKACEYCHPRQHREWQGSMMSYGATSPVFSALELLGNRLTGGALAKGENVTDGSDLFCQRCHNPVDVALDNMPTFADSGGQPLANFASPIGRMGLSCDLCHQVSGPDVERNLVGDLGDGISNNAVTIVQSIEKFGPFGDAEPNPYHVSTNSNFLRSSDFCGGCHDVRPRAPDVVEGEPFQRLENLFTEWREGPYGPTAANTVGRVVSCQDCHMHIGPGAEPGTYPSGFAATWPDPGVVPERRISTHYFTGVDVALVPFPGQDDATLDEYGFPIGQKQRRDLLLQSAATIAVSVPDAVDGGDVLPIDVSVTNVGAGHNIPSGFSQERQMWIELTVTDADGDVVYQSGHLNDRAHPETREFRPDGNLHDEDLQNLEVVLDPATGAATTLEHGPDYNQRHDDPPVNLGLVNFGNEFLHVDEETGEEEEVFVPFLANHMDNTHSIPPLETRTNRYDVTVPGNTQGPLTVTARLRFRAFPPRFLRLLAQVAPNLLDEAVVDRNLIVEMAQADPVAVTVR